MPNFAFFLIACAAIIAACEIKKFRRTRHVLIFAACGLVLLGATDSVMIVEPNHVRVLSVSDKPYRIVEGFHLMVAGRPYEEMNISGEEITRRVSASAYGNTPDSKIRTEYKISANIAYRLDIEDENIRRYMDRTREDSRRCHMAELDIQNGIGCFDLLSVASSSDTFRFGRLAQKRRMEAFKMC